MIPALAAILLLCIAASAQAAPSWLSPANLSEPGRDANVHAVAFDNHDDALALWERFNGRTWVIQSAFRNAGESWQAPVTLSRLEFEAYEPRAVFDRRGDAIAVWEEYGSAVQASYRPAEGEWEAPVVISQELAEVPKIAVDARGDAMVVWRSHFDNVQEAYKPAGGEWEAPVTITRGEGGEVGAPTVQLDANGDAVTAWERYIGSAWVVQAASKPAGGSWQAPVEVSIPARFTFSLFPRLAVDAAGDAVIVWKRLETSSGSESEQAASKPAGGSWQVPITISASGETASEPGVAIDPAGDVLAIWSGGGTMRSAFRPAGGSWQAPVQISQPGGEAYGNEVSFGPEGKALAAWQRSNGSNLIVQGALRSPGGAWGAPSNLSEAGESARIPHLAFDGQGDALVAWRRSNGSNEIVQASAYDAAGPLLNALMVPETGYTGEALSFSVSPLDVFSALGTTTWSFGDGSSASGTAVTHSYAKAGSYEVTVTSEDALGNRTTVSRTISITSRVETAEYRNWSVAGSLLGEPLNQPITLPAGSTFNGHGEVNTLTGAGSVEGTLAIPPFTTTLKLAGVVPLSLGMVLTPSASLHGSVAPGAQSGEEILGIPASVSVGVTSIGVLNLHIPVSCSATEALTLALSTTLTRAELLFGGWSFAGTTTLSPFQCQGGPLGGILAFLLSDLLSGPEQPYALSFRPPA